MKQILLLVLALGLFSNNVSAQTKKPIRKATTRTKPKANPIPKDSRDYQIGKDGYEWYKVCKNGKYGAEDRNGNTIVPAEYDGIIYDVGCYTCVGYSPVEAGFDVRKGESRGWYNKSGRCIIPYTRGYKNIQKYDDERYGTSYSFTKNGGGGLCDRYGRELVSVNIENLSHIELGYRDINGRRRYYLLFFVNNFVGIADANGKIVVYPEFEYNGNQEKLENLISTRVITTNNPLAGNTRETLAEAEGRQSGSYNSLSNNNTQNNSPQGQNNTIVVEHHRDPVPVQEWVQCTACWGSTICPNCAGSGTTYIGSNLHRCSRCGGRKICTSCSGKGGSYITVYK